MTDNFNAVFIEGDRMMTPFYPGVVLTEMFKAHVAGKTIITGTEDGGIEQLVRHIAQEVGLEISVVESHALDVPENPGHWRDWDKRHLALDEHTEVLIIHVDHQDCRESKSALAVLPDERVRMWSPVDLGL